MVACPDATTVTMHRTRDLLMMMMVMNQTANDALQQLHLLLLPLDLLQFVEMVIIAVQRLLLLIHLPMSNEISPNLHLLYPVMNFCVSLLYHLLLHNYFILVVIQKFDNTQSKNNFILIFVKIKLS